MTPLSPSEAKGGHAGGAALVGAMEAQGVRAPRQETGPGPSLQDATRRLPCPPPLPLAGGSSGPTSSQAASATLARTPGTRWMQRRGPALAWPTEPGRRGVAGWLCQELPKRQALLDLQGAPHATLAAL